MGGKSGPPGTVPGGESGGYRRNGVSGEDMCILGFRCFFNVLVGLVSFTGRQLFRYSYSATLVNGGKGLPSSIPIGRLLLGLLWRGRSLL